jgi:hypothetical protein
MRPTPGSLTPPEPQQNIGQGRPLPERALDPYGTLAKAEQRFCNQQISTGVDILKGERSIESSADQQNVNLAQQVLGWPPKNEEFVPVTPPMKDQGRGAPVHEPREDVHEQVFPQTKYEQAWMPGGKVDPNAPEFVTPFMESMWKPQEPPPAEQAGIDDPLGPSSPFHRKPWDPFS